MESLDICVTRGGHGAVRPAIGEQRKLLPRIPHRFIEFFYEKSATKGRLQGGDQEPVVAARLETRKRAERVAADAIGHQPLARFRFAKVAASFAAEIDLGRKLGRGNVGGTGHREIMEPSWRLGPEKNWRPQAETGARKIARVTARNERPDRRGIRAAS